MKALNKFILQLTAVVFGVMLAGAAMAQPANDLCTGAIAVTCGQTVTGNTNTSGIDNPPACGLTFPRYGVWYRFTGTGQSVTLSTCSATTNFDTQIAVFSGTCTALACVAGNNDDYTCSSNARNSRVTFNSVCGTDYYIWVTGKLSSRGAFALSVACTGTPCPPPPTSCSNTTSFGSATINASGAVVTISTCSYAGEYSTISGAVSGQTLRFTSSVATDVITIRSGTFNGPVVAFGTTPLQFTNTFTGTLFAHWNTPGCGAQSSCRTTTVQCTSCSPAPGDNDLCSATVPTIACGSSTQGSTLGATADAVGTCVTTLNTAPGRWFRFIGTGQTVSISTCNAFTNYDTKIGVFTGTCGALTCVTGNDDSACAFSGLRSLVTFASTSGVTYYVLITGFSAGAGNFQLDVTCSTPLAEGNNGLPVELHNVGKVAVGEFFPNPAQFDNTNVKIYSPNESNARIVLFDNLGRAVYNQEVELYSGENNVELQLSNLAIGTYYAAIDVNGETVRKKLVIVR